MPGTIQMAQKCYLKDEWVGLRTHIWDRHTLWSTKSPSQPLSPWPIGLVTSDKTRPSINLKTAHLYNRIILESASQCECEDEINECNIKQHIWSTADRHC